MDADFFIGNYFKNFFKIKIRNIKHVTQNCMSRFFRYIPYNAFFVDFCNEFTIFLTYVFPLGIKNLLQQKMFE